MQGENIDGTAPSDEPISPESGVEAAGDDTQPAEGSPDKEHRGHRTLLIAIVCSVVAFCLGAAVGAFAYSQYRGWQLESALEYLADYGDEEDDDESSSSTSRSGYDWYISDELADTVLTDLLPVPSWADVDESAGTVELEGDLYDSDEEEFSADLYISSKDVFKEYVKACKDAGFNDVVDDESSYFCADNDFGVELDIYFENYGYGDIEMTVELWVWDSDDYEAEMDGSQSGASTGSAAGTTSGASDSELIEFLDEYEEFIEDYVDFMQEYQNASYSDMTSMLSDYSDMLEEYESLSEELDSYDTDDMTSEELERYLEVTESVADMLSDL